MKENAMDPRANPLNILHVTRRRAETMRKDRGCGRTPKNDVVWLCMPDVGYKRTLDMSRSEVFQVFNKMEVKVKGGDMERLWWWMEETGKGFSREDFYSLLGGEIEKGNEARGAQEGSEEELSVEKRRKLHAVCLKANAIIRGCAHFDTGGDGKVATEVFVDALAKSVDDVGEGDIDMVLDAVQGEQEDKGYVKYSGLVFKIGLFLDKHTKLKEQVVEEEKKRGKKNVLISGAELFGGDIYINSSNQVYEGGKKHFEGRGGGGGRDHLQGDYMEKDSSSVEVQEERRRYGVDLHRGWGSGGKKHFEGRGGGGGRDHLQGGYMELDASDPEVQEERKRYGVNLHRGWGSGGKKRFEGREGGGGRDHIRGDYMDLDASDPMVQAERKRYGVVNEVLGKGKRHYSADDYIPTVEKGGEEGGGGIEGRKGGEEGGEGERGGRKDGIDQFGYLRINAPEPEEIRTRTSQHQMETDVGKDLKWATLTGKPSTPVRKNPKAKLLQDAAETMFMNRPELAVAFRTADGSRMGSLDASDLTEMLMNSRLKSGLDRREAKEVALELFKRAGKDPNTVARVNFNDLAIAIGDVLEGKKPLQQQPGAG